MGTVWQTKHFTQDDEFRKMFVSMRGNEEYGSLTVGDITDTEGKGKGLSIAYQVKDVFKGTKVVSGLLLGDYGEGRVEGIINNDNFVLNFVSDKPDSPTTVVTGNKKAGAVIRGEIIDKITIGILVFVVVVVVGVIRTALFPKPVHRPSVAPTIKKGKKPNLAGVGS
eukprot:TRINITY_DN4365_c0_g1_i2.p1 TRINITY_DN4365_c0_g1~~TRINITY_DN4365_c0_g1_i2.p1  ORF type:complete len:167 (+),score=67.39 TRINITY_DN4365_c0_g1_i2:326-826(+)